MTNYSGIEWLKRQLGEEYNVHILPFEDVRAYHIDASMFIPKPGIVVFNPNLNFKDFGMFERAGWKVSLLMSGAVKSFACFQLSLCLASFMEPIKK